MTSFGDLMARLMAEQGVSLHRLAKIVHYDVGYLSKVRSGKKPASRKLAAQLDSALKAGGELESLAPQPQPTRFIAGSDGWPTLGDHWLALPTAQAGVATETQPWPYGLAPAAGSTVTAADVAVIRGMLDALMASERQFGGGHARGYASDYLRGIVWPQLRARASHPVFRDLCAVSVEFSLRVASMQLDVGNAAASRALLGAALPLAQETGDPVVVAWVLARFGELDMHEKHVDRAMAYTRGAAAMARRSPAGARSFIFAKHALAIAMTGDRTEALRVLGQVHSAYENAGRGGEPAWMRGYGLEHLRHDEGRCLNYLGMGDQAVQAAEDSMRARRFSRPKAFSLAVQAIGHAKSKDKAVDRACEIGHELITITSQLASDRVRTQLANVLTTLRPYRMSAPVQELMEAAQPVLRDSPG
jgi:hypothetical protein